MVKFKKCETIKKKYFILYEYFIFSYSIQIKIQFILAIDKNIYLVYRFC